MRKSLPCIAMLLFAVGLLFIIPFEYNKTCALFQVLLKRNIVYRGKFGSCLLQSILNFADYLLDDLSHCFLNC
jgi:hypothetical protein